MLELKGSSLIKTILIGVVELKSSGKIVLKLLKVVLWNDISKTWNLLLGLSLRLLHLLDLLLINLVSKQTIGSLYVLLGRILLVDDLLLEIDTLGHGRILGQIRSLILTLILRVRRRGDGLQSCGVCDVRGLPIVP